MRPRKLIFFIFGAQARKFEKYGPGSTFCIFGALARKCEKYSPGSAFSAFSDLKPGNAKNTIREAHFLHFRISGQEMRKTRSRKLIFCIFGILARKCEKYGPGSSFSAFSKLRPGNAKKYNPGSSFSVFSELKPGNAKNTVQDHFLHFRSSGQEMRKIRSRKFIFCIFGGQVKKCEEYSPGSAFSAISELRPIFISHPRSGQRIIMRYMICI